MFCYRIIFVFFIKYIPLIITTYITKIEKSIYKKKINIFIKIKLNFD